MKPRWRTLVAAFALLLPSMAAAQTASPEEVKAAFLFRFAAFVEWPAQSRTDEGIVFGVVDAHDVEAELRRYASQRAIGNRAPVVRNIETPADLAGVHILFVGSRDAGSLSRWAAAARQHPVLVVTDAPDALERGSMINFHTTDRVRFEASPEAATRAGLRLTPRLLSVATRVKKGDAGDDTVLAGHSAARPTA